MPGSPDPKTQLPLTPAVFHILLTLVDGDRHGYAIMQQVLERSDGQVRLGPGTLYGAIKRLLAGGLIEEKGEGADPGLGDERRRYYKISAFGVRVTQAETQRMAALVHLARTHEVLRLPGLETA